MKSTWQARVAKTAIAIFAIAGSILAILWAAAGVTAGLGMGFGGRSGPQTAGVIVFSLLAPMIVSVFLTDRVFQRLFAGEIAPAFWLSVSTLMAAPIGWLILASKVFDT